MDKIFCIDIGNTRTHCACVACRDGAFEVSCAGDFPSADFADIFRTRHLFETSDASGISWCSVVPKYSEALADAFKHISAPIVGLSHKNSPMPLDILRPEQLGQDRIADALGAGVFLTPPYLVVDMGTAVTIDLVDARGHYAGGAIAPGMSAFVDYLASRTAQLPAINPADADCTLSIGKDTVQAMSVGCAKGFCKLVDGLIADIERDFFGGESAFRKTVFTGGSVDYLPREWLGDRLVNRDLAYIGLAKSFIFNKTETEL